MAIKILSTGSFLGKHKVDNKTLYHKVSNFDLLRASETLQKKGNNTSGLNPETIFDLWVQQVCGIESRVFFDRSEMDASVFNIPFPTEYMGCMAGKEALTTAGISGATIDHVIFCSYTPQQLMPNPACLAAHFLGTEGASATHINTACSSFLDGLGLAYMMIKAKEKKRVLVIASDLMSENLDFSDVTTSILFGDGACAAILEDDPSSSSGFLSYASQTSYNSDMLSMLSGQPIRMQGGPLVQRNAINAMTSALTLALEKVGMNLSNVTYLIPHQANLRIIHRLADKLEIPYDKTLQSVKETGNVSGAAFGIGLDYAFKGKIHHLHFQSGEILGMTTIGGGYTYSGMIYKI